MFHEFAKNVYGFKPFSPMHVAFPKRPLECCEIDETYGTFWRWRIADTGNPTVLVGFVSPLFKSSYTVYAYDMIREIFLRFDYNTHPGNEEKFLRGLFEILPD